MDKGIVEKLREEEKAAEELMFGTGEDPSKEALPTDDDSQELEFEVAHEDPTDDQGVPEEIDPTPAQPERKQRTNWKKRFTNYKATTDDTISSLRKDLAALNVKVQEQSAALTKLRRENYELSIAHSSKKEEDDFEDIFSQEDRDLIGTEAIDIIKKAVKAGQVNKTDTQDALREEIAELKAERVRLAKKEQQELEDASFKELQRKLRTIVPDWEVIDVQPQFVEYLREKDTYSTKSRGDLLAIAIRTGDVANVARFYKDFKALQPASREEVLSNRVTPEGGAGAGLDIDENGKAHQKIYSINEYNIFMDSITKGEWKGREKEAKKIEAIYDRAFMEGRLR